MDPQPLPVELDVLQLLPDGGSASLHCRLPSLGDIGHLVEACQDPDIPRWTTVPSPYGEAEGRGYVEFSLNRWGARSGLHLVIIAGEGHPLADLPLLGTVGADINWVDAEAEVGYWIHAPARRHGIASAATAAMCRLLLDAGLQRLSARVITGNTGSVRTLEKVGFRVEGTLRGLAAGGCGDGADRIDEHILGLLPGDFVG